MSKPNKMKVEYNWGPRCWFFDEAMAAHNFNGTEHAIMYVVQRLTYSEPDWDRPGRRKEGAKISHAEFKRRTGRALSAIQKAITRLESANVLIVIKRGLGRGVTSEYGINARIDEWKIERIGTVDEVIYPGKNYLKKTTSNSEKDTSYEVHKGQSDLPQLRYNNSEFEVVLGVKRGSFSTSEPYSHKGPLVAKEILRVKEKKEEEIFSSQPVPKKVRILSDLDERPAPLPLITCPDEALRYQNLSPMEAYSQAARLYTGNFGRDLSPVETESLEAFIGLSEFKGTLLRIWIMTIEPARDKWKAEKPKTKQGKTQSPFWTLREMAGDEFADLKGRRKSS